MSKTLHGGRRPGSGRKMKGDSPRVPLCLSVDQDTKEMYHELRQELKAQGEDLLQTIEFFIRYAYDAYYKGKKVSMDQVYVTKPLDSEGK